MSKGKMEAVGLFTMFNMICTNYFGSMAPLLYIVIILMGMDLITRGYAAASRTDERLQSKKVIAGLYKKLGLCFLIVLSLILDFGVKELSESLGITIATKIIFTNLTLAWLFVRELISNLENLQWAGVELPTFIVSALSLAKEKVDSMGDMIVNDSSKNTQKDNEIKK